MRVVKVAVVGASGETGQSVVEALLSSPDIKFEVTALTRPQSVNKTVNTQLASRGVKIIPADLNGPFNDLVEHLKGIHIVISAIYFNNIDDEIPLANAAKAAGVERFIQSALMIVIPPGEVVDFRRKKEGILHHIQKIRLPYTYLDAGWWYQLILPRLPSGRTDHLVALGYDPPLGRDGNVPTALADIRDIGRYMVRVVMDPRTLNKRVHVYNEVYTQNGVYEVVERLSGEQLPRRYVSEEEAAARINEAREALNKDPNNMNYLMALTSAQLFYSWAIRGDNTPENAEYLGYISGRDLYPDFEYVKFEDYVKEALEGRNKGVYQRDG